MSPAEITANRLSFRQLGLRSIPRPRWASVPLRWRFGGSCAALAYASSKYLHPGRYAGHALRERKMTPETLVSRVLRDVERGRADLSQIAACGGNGGRGNAPAAFNALVASSAVDGPQRSRNYRRPQRIAAAACSY